MRWEPAWIGRQFALPLGVLGRIAGWVMAVGNADMERAAIERLRLTGHERVLEIGFGPGIGLRLLAGRLPAGFVAGIEPSRVMLEQARRRCRRVIADAQLDLRPGTSSSLPWPDAAFDAVVSVNNVQLWEHLDADLAEVRRVLAPGGRLSIAVHEWVVQDPIVDGRGAGRFLGDALPDVIAACGFTAPEVRRGRARSGRALYLLARRS